MNNLPWNIVLVFSNVVLTSKIKPLFKGFCAWFSGRLILGICDSWKCKKYTFLGVNWSYEAAMIAKGYEVAFEAGLQTLVMTYVHMKTGWLSINVFKDLTKAYMQGGGIFSHFWFYSALQRTSCASAPRSGSKGILELLCIDHSLQKKSIVTKINYMNPWSPKNFLSVGYEAKSRSSGE